MKKYVTLSVIARMQGKTGMFSNRNYFNHKDTSSETESNSSSGCYCSPHTPENSPEPEYTKDSEIPSKSTVSKTNTSSNKAWDKGYSLFWLLLTLAAVTIIGLVFISTPFFLSMVFIGAVATISLQIIFFSIFVITNIAISISLSQDKLNLGLDLVGKQKGLLFLGGTVIVIVNLLTAFHTFPVGMVLIFFYSMAQYLDIYSYYICFNLISYTSPRCVVPLVFAVACIAMSIALLAWPTVALAIGLTQASVMLYLTAATFFIFGAIALRCFYLIAKDVAEKKETFNKMYNPFKDNPKHIVIVDVVHVPNKRYSAITISCKTIITSKKYMLTKNQYILDKNSKNIRSKSESQNYQKIQPL